MNGYNFPPYRRDRNAHGGGKIVFVRQGLISRRITEFENPDLEDICIELTLIQ